MILSRYQNPPYRSPTPRKCASPPPPDPSPKRKRSESVDGPLRIQTNLREDLLEESPVSGCDSPRSKVAEKLRDLDIDRPNSKSGPAAGSDDVHAKRKRQKINSRARVASPSPCSEHVIAETPAAKRSKGAKGQNEPPEIQETPRVDRQPSSSPNPATEDALVNFRKAFEASQTPSHAAGTTRSPETTPLPPSPKVMISPPTHTHTYDQYQNFSSSPPSAIPDRALSPLNLSEKSSQINSSEPLDLDQASLTWQDAEITGHEIDASLGDDGLGINGIGFRPTPAMAHARSLKRKQQVSEWKAREAREARQRRMERRNREGAGLGGEGVSVGVGEGEVRRVVRFEGVG